MPQDQRPPSSAALSVLSEGKIELQGRMPWSSNQTFLASCSLDDQEMLAVYKPARGERPLWDFPGGLYRREVAAYELSRTLGWDLVPETILRFDAPFGEGSLQRFVPAHFEQHYFTLLEEPEHLDELRRMGTFDILANNADRKAGHCLVGLDGKIWGIDNGLCFHVEPKLRTVIWDFAGEALADQALADIAALVGRGLPDALVDLLQPDEVEAILTRAARMAKRKRFPAPHPDARSYPWPLV